MRMRAMGWGLLGLAAVGIGCGGALAPSYPGPDPDAGTDLDVVADETGAPKPAPYCIFMACGGISACTFGETCPVGDGCNTCSCALDSAGMTATTCTTDSC